MDSPIIRPRDPEHPRFRERGEVVLTLPPDTRGIEHTVLAVKMNSGPVLFVSANEWEETK